MTAESLLEELQSMQVELAAQGNRLRWRAPKGLMTPELSRTIAEFKPQILALVQGRGTLARVRGQDRIEVSGEAEACWHCHGKKVCSCAYCGEYGQGFQWQPSQCGSCKGSGYLCWSDTVH